MRQGTFSLVTRYNFALDRVTYVRSLFSRRILVKPFLRNSGRRLQADAGFFILLILHQTIFLHAAAKATVCPDRQARSGRVASGGSSLDGYDPSCHNECPVDMLNLAQLQERLFERRIPGLGVELHVQGALLESRNDRSAWASITSGGRNTCMSLVCGLVDAVLTAVKATCHTVGGWSDGVEGDAQPPSQPTGLEQAVLRTLRECWRVLAVQIATFLVTSQQTASEDRSESITKTPIYGDEWVGGVASEAIGLDGDHVPGWALTAAEDAAAAFPGSGSGSLQRQVDSLLRELKGCPLDAAVVRTCLKSSEISFSEDMLNEVRPEFWAAPASHCYRWNGDASGVSRNIWSFSGSAALVTAMADRASDALNERAGIGSGLMVSTQQLLQSSSPVFGFTDPHNITSRASRISNKSDSDDDSKQESGIAISFLSTGHRLADLGSPAARRAVVAPILWLGGCSCRREWEPVCDAATGQQHPNRCYADCHGVASRAVQCSDLLLPQKPGDAPVPASLARPKEGHMVPLKGTPPPHPLASSDMVVSESGLPHRPPPTHDAAHPIVVSTDAHEAVISQRGKSQTGSDTSTAAAAAAAGAGAAQWRSIFAASLGSPSSARTAVRLCEEASAETMRTGLQRSASTAVKADMRRPFLAVVSAEPNGLHATASCPESWLPTIWPQAQRSAWILLAQLLQPAAELLRSPDDFPNSENGGKPKRAQQALHTTGKGISKLYPGRVASPLGSQEASSDSRSGDACDAGGRAMGIRRRSEVGGQMEGDAPSLRRLIHLLNLLAAARLYDGDFDDPPEGLGGSGR